MSTGEFVQLNKENEHILVCLSSSPSNEKIIRTAAKMARDMRARFTALYVQTGKRERESDKRRLEAHVQFAKESGAEIVMGKMFRYRSRNMHIYQMSQKS